MVVWAAESLFSQNTTPFGLIIALDGMKQFGSQPGTEEPSAFSTIFSANALGTASPIAKSTTNDDMINCDFVDPCWSLF